MIQRRVFVSDTLRFRVLFHPNAFVEYRNLDGSARKLVDDALRRLQYRADEIGKRLGNRENSPLHGCKEIKFRKAGIRIVFFVSGRQVAILRVVYVLAVGPRAAEKVFQTAALRRHDMELADSDDE